MPHDRKGNLLQVGDRVALLCDITAIQPGEDYCNVNISTVEKMYPGEYTCAFSVNAKQLIVLAKGFGEDPDDAA